MELENWKLLSNADTPSGKFVWKRTWNELSVWFPKKIRDSRETRREFPSIQPFLVRMSSPAIVSPRSPRLGSGAIQPFNEVNTTCISHTQTCRHLHTHTQHTCTHTHIHPYTHSHAHTLTHTHTHKHKRYRVAFVCLFVAWPYDSLQKCSRCLSPNTFAHFLFTCIVCSCFIEKIYIKIWVDLNPQNCCIRPVRHRISTKLVGWKDEASNLQISRFFWRLSTRSQFSEFIGVFLLGESDPRPHFFNLALKMFFFAGPLWVEGPKQSFQPILDLERRGIASFQTMLPTNYPLRNSWLDDLKLLK